MKTHHITSKTAMSVVTTVTALSAPLAFAQCEVAKLGPPGAQAEWFGWGIDLDGPYAAIGAPPTSDTGDGNTAVFRLDNNGTSGSPFDDHWVVVAEFVESNGFGYPVALQDPYLAVGNLSGDANGVHVYYHDDNGTPVLPDDDLWTEVTYLDVNEKASLGEDIALDGDWLVIGAAYADDANPGDSNCDSGAVFFYRRDDAGTPANPYDDTWIEHQREIAPDMACHSRFGVSTAIRAPYAVIGASLDSEVALSAGAAYIYQLDDGGTASNPADDVWLGPAKLTASDGGGGHLFGHSVAMDIYRLVIGAYQADGPVPNTGAAYVFVRDDAGTPSDPLDDSWNEEAKLAPPEPPFWGGDYFGWKVDIDGDRVAVGAPLTDTIDVSDGAVYLYERVGTSWIESAKLVASDVVATGFNYDQLGSSLALDGGWLIAGAPEDNDICSGCGAAYVFAIDGQDGNSNGLLDVCEGDCNTNGIVDSNDITFGTSTDCNANELPDDCESQDDCNSNGVQDICDLASGMHADCNANGVLDECEGVSCGSGDGDQDGDVDLDDLSLFTACLDGTPGDPTVCVYMDMNGDGVLNLIDYGRFQQGFTGALAGITKVESLRDHMGSGELAIPIISNRKVEPRDGGIQIVRVTFSAPMDPVSCTDSANILITGASGGVQSVSTAATMDPSATQLRISIGAALPDLDCYVFDLSGMLSAELQPLANPEFSIVGLVGDVTGDRVVSVMDGDEIDQHWSESPSEAADTVRYDVDLSGEISPFDSFFITNPMHWGMTAPDCGT